LKRIKTINTKEIENFKRKLLFLSKKNFEDFPWRQKNKPFHLLIAEILLQRTKAEQVVPVYIQFKKQFPSARSLARAKIVTVENLIFPLGLKWRAANLIQLADKLSNKYRGTPPLDINELLNLSGVGPYAAGAFLSLHSNIRAIIPDANMIRILGRFFGFSTHAETRREKLFLELCDRITPKRKFLEFNYAILDHGRKICLPKKPLCSICVLNKKCSYFIEK